MSRNEPISVEELLQQKRQEGSTAKPVFLSKKKREELKLAQAQQSVPKPKVIAKKRVFEDEPGQLHSASPPVIQRSKPQQINGAKRAKKFNFDWDPEADTSAPESAFLISVRKNPSTKQDQIVARHWSEKPLKEMTDRDWRILKEDFEISNKGGSVLSPLRSWDESEIPQEVLKQLRQLNYLEPTPIQRATIPTALSGRDIIGIAETGSGKTLAFIVPILAYILKRPSISHHNRDQGPYCLVVVPTRELALQIEKEFNKFKLGFRCCSIIGGHSFEELIHKIRDGVEVIIATPGRLNDCIERKIVVFNQCHYLVMDEADRMINMGFEAQVNKILQMLPPDRRTMMFTATMPPEIEKMTGQYLTKPGIVMIGEVGNAVDTVVQEVEFFKDEGSKMARLLKILRSGEFIAPIIVFVNYKRTGDEISTKLTKEGFKCVSMHGSKNQEQREAAIASIKRGDSEILIATDVAGRGIDINNVSLVVNYQMSRSIEDYTHRIGRTGRAGKLGHAITFLTDKDDEVLTGLKKIISNSSVSKVTEELGKRELARQTVSRNIVN